MGGRDDRDRWLERAAASACAGRTSEKRAERPDAAGADGEACVDMAGKEIRVALKEGC